MTMLAGNKGAVKLAALFADIIENFDESRHIQYSLFESYGNYVPGCKVCAMGSVLVGLLGDEFLAAELPRISHDGDSLYDTLYSKAMAVAAERVGPVTKYDMSVVSNEVTGINDSVDIHERPFSEVAALIRESFGITTPAEAGTDG